MNAAQGDVSVSVRFPAGLYDLEALKRAAYQLSGKLTVEIEPGDSHTSCTLRRKSDKIDLQGAADEFRTAVLDHDLRIRVGKETEPVRNLILSLAFSKTGLQG